LYWISPGWDVIYGPISFEDILADFAHQLRQPLSAIALACYLDLIATPDDARVSDPVRLIHGEIARSDHILRGGLCTLRASLLNGSPMPVDDAGGGPKISCQPDQY